MKPDRPEQPMQAISLRNVVWDVTPDAIRGVWTRIEATSVGARLARGTFWALAGTVVSRALALAAAIVVARVLGKSQYGEWGIIQSTVGMFGTLAGFGMGTTTAKFVAEFRETNPEKAGRIIALSSCVTWAASLTLAGLLVLASPWLSAHTLGAPYVSPYLQLSALLLVLSGVNGAQNGVLSGFEAFKDVARVNLLAGLANFPMMVGGAWLFGLPGLILGTCLAQAIGCVFNLVALRRMAARYAVPISYLSCMRERSVLWQFSTPAVLIQLVISAVNWAAAAMLVRQPNGFAAMGAFNAANQWFNALLWLPYVVNRVTLPLLSERIGAKDKISTVRLLKMSVRMNAAVALPIMAVGCLLSRFIMTSYGAGFESEWPTLVIVLLNGGLLAMVMPVGEVMSARGHMWLGLSTYVIWAPIFLLASARWAESAAFGLASARLLAYFVHGIFIVVYAAIFIGARHDSPKSDELRVS